MPHDLFKQGLQTKQLLVSNSQEKKTCVCFTDNHHIIGVHTTVLWWKRLILIKHFGLM